jgi:murein DD-endopeptidase MepM/ murein hydrolase activator NlpD
MRPGKTKLIIFGGGLSRSAWQYLLRLALLTSLFLAPGSLFTIHIPAEFPPLLGRDKVSNTTGKELLAKDVIDSEAWVYYTQSGDTLRSIARRFQVAPELIYSPPQVGFDQLLDPGLMLIIPRPVHGSYSAVKILPDNEIVFSPSVQAFDTLEYVAKSSGFLGTDEEYMRSSGPTSAAEIVARVAQENSINPRLLLALLDYQCQCVSGPLPEGTEPEYLMGVYDSQGKGLYRQLGWVVNQLSLGYYGWRRGLLTDLALSDGSQVELPPDLNAGSAALAYLFSRLYDWEDWTRAMDSETGFAAHYRAMFTDLGGALEDPAPLFPPGLTQPNLILPFLADRQWGYTSGPHKAWETEGALAALDFAPSSAEYGCLRSNEWVLAMADGLVSRAEYGVVVIDLDGDGFEGSGWALLYMHLESRGRVAEGTYVHRGDPIGHPSCEGGPADGTHVHIARKYNGEWIAADGPLPFIMSDWQAQAGYRPFEGGLVREDQIVIANPLTPASAFISQSAADLRKYLTSSHDMWWEE